MSVSSFQENLVPERKYIPNAMKWALRAGESDLQKRLFISILQNNYFEKLKNVFKMWWSHFLKLIPLRVSRKWWSRFSMLQTLRIQRKWWSHFSVLKTLRQWRSPFFSIKNFKGCKKVTASFFSGQASLSFHMMDKFPGTTFSLSAPA